MLTSPAVASASSKRKAGEASELRYRRLFETAQNGILILDGHTEKITDANPYIVRLTQYNRDDLLGKELWEIGIFKDIKRSKDAFATLQKKGYIRYEDLPLQTKDGNHVEVEFISNVYDVAGKKVIQCDIRDISERKRIEKLAESKSEEALKLNKLQEETKSAMLNVMEDLEASKVQIEIERAKDEAMLTSIGEGLIAVDVNGKILVVNTVAEQMLGLEKLDMLGQNIDSVFLLQDDLGSIIPESERPNHKALTNGKLIDTKCFFLNKNSKRIPIAITVTPIILEKKIIGAVDIFRDITKEKENDRAKAEFVSLASHQLRTPLGIVKWYIEALKNEECFRKAPGAAREYIKEIEKSNERLLTLVHELLLISRIDQGSIKDFPKSTQFSSLVGDIVESMQIIAKKRKVSLFLHKEKTAIPTLFMDPMRLREVVENLIANAIIYNNSGGKVDVSLGYEKNKIFITVKDTGIGISLEDQKNLFTKFFRSDKATIKNAEGSGLGLYVVKSYVQGWGGSVAVKSEEGKGSTFIIEFPVVRDKKSKTKEEKKMPQVDTIQTSTITQATALKELPRKKEVIA